MIAPRYVAYELPHGLSPVVLAVYSDSSGAQTHSIEVCSTDTVQRAEWIAAALNAYNQQETKT